MIDSGSVLLAFCIMGGAAFIVYLGWDTFRNTKSIKPKEENTVHADYFVRILIKESDLFLKSYNQSFIDKKPISFNEENDYFNILNEMGYRGLYE